MLAKRLQYDDALLEHLREIYGDDLEQLMESLLTPPRRLYLRVNLRRISRDELLSMLRERGIMAYPDKYLEEAIYVEIKGPNKIPVTDARVVVDKKTAESVMMGANVYAPGVVDVPRTSPGREVNIVAPNGVLVGLGILINNYEEALKKRKGIVVKTITSLYDAPKLRELPEWENGFFYEQSYPSIIASRLLDKRKVKGYIVDMCAAPGGKLSHIASLCSTTCEVLGFDRSGRKILETYKTLRRLGIGNAVLFKADSRYLDLDHSYLINRIRGVILDPPCSNLGVRPKVYDVKSFRDILSYAEYQKQFIKPAYKLLKSSGLLVYSTCTLTVEENEKVVAYAVEKYGFRVVDIDIGRKGIAREAYFEGVFVGLRFEPHLHDTPGHFLSLLIKP